VSSGTRHGPSIAERIWTMDQSRIGGLLLVPSTLAAII
jgi:hypothetical protein